MNGKSAKYILGLLSLILCVLTVSGQKTVFNPKELDSKFAQIWKTSEATRKKYTWKASTEVIRDGEVMQILVEEISYGSDGRQIRKVISNQETPLPSIFLIRRVAEDQKAKIVAYMSELRSFLEKYALDDDGVRRSFFSLADMGVPDANGQVLVSGTDVFARDDELKWWIDTKFYTITRATISTTYKGIRADFSAKYYYLPGLNYMAEATIRIPSKGMVINLRFYDFVRKPLGIP